MPLFAFNYLKETFKGSLKSKNVFLLGVSYRSDISDTRYTFLETPNIYPRKSLHILLNIN